MQGNYCKLSVLYLTFSNHRRIGFYICNDVLNFDTYSQFGDIYQEEHFMEYLSPDIRIVKELPKELQSLDLEEIGSVVSFRFSPNLDADSIIVLLFFFMFCHFYLLRWQI